MNLQNNKQIALCCISLAGGSCTVREAVVTVLCTPDDGCFVTPETCRVNLQNNKQTALCCILLVGGSYTVRVAVVTVLCTPDDGSG